ncbi:MAG TPA: hypothetical protein G4O02_06785 [Caldilineae bacterium]|jgi:hypothetical protein|nr:hypothetical protein [Caldilineae bacterium]
MIRPFGLRHCFLVRRLQKRGVQLDMERALVQARSPLWVALTTPIPWQMNGVATYVLHARVRGRRLEGFIQVQKRWGRAEASLMYLAPDLGAEHAEEIWRRLLQYCCRKAGENGVQRMYASLPDEAEHLQVFRDAGFSLYAREELFRLKFPRPSEEVGTGDIRAVYEADDWQLKRLYAQHTPRLVQLAEGAVGGDHKPPFLTGVEWADVQSYVLAEAQEITGLVQILSGRHGHLLRLWGDTTDSMRMVRLLHWGIQVASQKPVRPVYCAVRDYQGGLQALLEESGFEYIGHRTRLVKHIVRAEQVSAANTVTALDPRTEAITTVSGLHISPDNGGAEQPAPVYSEEQAMNVAAMEPR